jgi:hypothetical protein
MPPGYSLEAPRKKLEEQLRQARADELAQASFLKRKRIEFEIKAEVNRQLRRIHGRFLLHGSVLWMQ